MLFRSTLSGAETCEANQAGGAHAYCSYHEHAGFIDSSKVPAGTRSTWAEPGSVTPVADCGHALGVSCRKMGAPPLPEELSRDQPYLLCVVIVILAALALDATVLTKFS